MRDDQELIDMLQAVIASPGEWDQGELTQLATEYAEQCGAVNRRLNECFKLFRAGQTAEAIRLAELEPRLSEWAAMLDFPEREQWASLCELMGLALPPALLHDRIKMLNEAYTLSPSMEGLLRLWRYQNLRRATIGERLATLRRLAAVDATNLIWYDDIRTFEEAWLLEINQEVSAAFRADDHNQLLRLRAQVESSSWNAQVRSGVLEIIERALKTLERNRLNARLKQVTEQINAAYAAADDQALGDALREFDKLCENLKMDADDPRRIAVEPAREWCQERTREAEQRKKAATAEAALDRELDQPQTVEQLVKLHDAATAGERKLPIELERRYHLVVDRLETEQRRRHELRLVAAGLVAIVLLAVVFVVAWLMMRESTRAAAAQSIDTFIAKNQLQSADEFVRQLEKEQPGVYQSPVVQAALRRLADAQKKEKHRKQEFQTLVARIEERLENPQGNPSKDDVERLSALARETDERLEAQKIARRAEERWREQNRQARDQWNERFSAMTEEVDRLEKADISLVTPEEIRKLEENLRDLSHDASVPESLRSSTSPLLTRLTVIKSQREQFEQNLKRLQSLIGAVGRRGAFEASLRELARDADYRFAADCEKTANTLPWDAVDAWNALAALWNTHRQDPSPAIMGRLLATVERTKYPTAGPDGWSDVLQSRWRPYVEAVARRDEVAMGTILKLWNAPIVTQTYRYCEVTDNQETILYAMEDYRDKLSAQTVGISALVADHPFTEKFMIQKRTLKGPSVLFADISPQRRLRDDLNASLNTVSTSAGNLEKKACDLLLEMVAAQEKLKSDWDSAAQAATASGRAPESRPRVPVNDYIFAELFANTVTAVSLLSPVFAEHWEPAVKELKINLARATKDWPLYEHKWAPDSNTPEIRLPTPSHAEAEALAAATMRALEEVQRPLPTLRWVGFVYYVDENTPSPCFYGPEDSLRANMLLIGVPSLSSSRPDIRALRNLATVDDVKRIIWQYSSIPFGTPVFVLEDTSAAASAN
ncbi:MAG: hypothetical protein ACUVQK_14520 [Thermogutta sp.]